MKHNIKDVCSICQKPNNKSWKSALYIMNEETKRYIKKLSICPQCRRLYSIEYLYYVTKEVLE
jgi:uncharacterized protein with PIN domain